MNRTEILQEANRIITEDRQDTHGRPEDNFRKIAALWSTYLDYELHAIDVGVMMILLKLVRFQNNPDHLDNTIDIVGYGAILGEITALDDNDE